MKSFWIGLFLIGSFYFLSGFINKITVESYRIIVDYEGSTSSSSSKKDDAYSSLYIREQDINEVDKRHFVASGPYHIHVGVEINGQTEHGKPLHIIVEKSEILVVKKNEAVETIDVAFSKDKDGEVFQEEKFKNQMRQYLRIGLSFEELNIDFENLKELIFYVEFKGVYEDGTTKNYWSKKVAYPKYTKEKYNPFIKSLMSI